MSLNYSAAKGGWSESVGSNILRGASKWLVLQIIQLVAVVRAEVENI